MTKVLVSLEFDLAEELLKDKTIIGNIKEELIDLLENEKNGIAEYRSVKIHSLTV